MRLPAVVACVGMGLSTGAVGAASDAVVQVMTPLDFQHKVYTEDATRGREFVITNTGSDPLVYTGAGLTITGPDADEFVITKMPMLEPQGNLATDVRRGEVAFSPKSVGLKSASLVVTTNDPAEPAIILPLSGIGLADRGTTVTGPYSGYGPGVSRIGPGGDYTSLADACTSISTTPLTGGDWTFEILGDLTETRNSAIAQRDTNGNLFIFRPAEGVNATVTFTNASSQSPQGHILIGGSHQSVSSQFQRVPTDGIVIDGSWANGESSRSLTLKNATESGLWSIIQVYGDCDETSIRNCLLESSSKQTLDTPVIRFASYGGNKTLSVPPAIADNCLIENCAIVTTMSASIQSISHDHDLRFADFPTNYDVSNPQEPGLIVRNNTFEATGVVLSVTTAQHVEMSSNTINFLVPQDQPQRVFRPHIVQIGNRYSPTVTAHTEISGNHFNVRGAAESAAEFSAITVLGTNTSSTCLIANNIITGITAAKTSVSSPVTRAAISVASGRESTATIAHNSIYMPASDNPPGQRVFAIGSGNASWPGDLIIRNNIVSMGVTEGHALSRYGSAGQFFSDYNDIHITSGSKAGIWSGTSLPELSDWQTSTGQDMSSISIDPFEPVAEGLGTWTQGPAVANLHFLKYPGSTYLAPKIAGLDTDIDGELRSNEVVIMGADEVPHYRARVADWDLY